MPHIHELYNFTTSAYILHPSKPKLLMLKHKKIGKWLQPGGHVELHEDPLETLHHELEEETGLTPDQYDIIETAESPKLTHDHKDEKDLPLPFYFNVHRFNDTHKHIDITYLVKSKTDKLTDNPDGASDIQWLTIEEIRILEKQGDIFNATLQLCEWVSKRYL